MKSINPYYRTKNKLFFKVNGKRTIVERISTGIYRIYGENPLNKTLNINFK